MLAATIGSNEKRLSCLRTAMSTKSLLNADIANILPFIDRERIEEKSDLARAVARQLERREGPGANFLGWLDLPSAANGADLGRMEDLAEQAAHDTDIVVVIGIGGSYLGAEAALSALCDRVGGPDIIFAGTHLSSPALARMLRHVEGRDLRLIVISKSGTTLEPAAAFRLFRNLMIRRYGRENAARRITAVTDASRGALRSMSDQEGYETYVIPDDVGGRFSVLTPVGLLPLAVAGLDIRALLGGAAAMRDRCAVSDLWENPAHLYAASRSALYDAGYWVEVLSSFHADVGPLQEWWKQLFGESEGKEGRGVFPASCRFTTDLHSLGQYLQDGRRELFETFLMIEQGDPALVVPTDAEEPGGADLERDGLAYLVGRSFDDINRKAFEGTRNAHTDGGVPNLTLTVPHLDEEVVGGLFYFFEKAVAISGRMLGVNPFDQPGVEAYKREMFRLLGKPGT